METVSNDALGCKTVSSDSKEPNSLTSPGNHTLNSGFFNPLSDSNKLKNISMEKRRETESDDKIKNHSDNFSSNNNKIDSISSKTFKTQVYRLADNFNFRKTKNN